MKSRSGLRCKEHLKLVSLRGTVGSGETKTRGDLRRLWRIDTVWTSWCYFLDRTLHVYP